MDACDNGSRSVLKTVALKRVGGSNPSASATNKNNRCYEAMERDHVDGVPGLVNRVSSSSSKWSENEQPIIFYKKRTKED